MPHTPPPPPSDARPRIGEYEVLQRIGSGAMGDVYEAVNPLIGRRVAIKVLRPAPRAPGAPTLLEEARAANRVQHPHIVEVFGFGTLPNGQDYLVMELLSGATLDQTLAEKRALGLEEALSVLEELLSALSALHATGAVHRDLKPGNVFLVKPPHGDPFVKLLDFGLTQPSGVSQPLAGTLRYLAPEQLAGEPSTVASDVFAAGCVAYKMLTGVVPFEADTPERLVELQRKRPRSMAGLNAEVPLRLDRLILSMLAVEPRERPTAASAFDEVRALQRHLRPAPAGASRAQAPAAPAPSPGLLGSLFRRPAPPAPTAPNRPAPVPPRARAADVRSLDLLNLSDLGAREREPERPPPVDLEPLQKRLLELGVRQVGLDGGLPTFPWVATRVIELIGQEQTGANDLVKLINQDPGLTTQVLRAANSAYASRGIEVVAARDAITRLGFREVADVMLAAATNGLFQDMRRADVVSLARRHAWIHSLTCAFSAAWLAMECGADAQKAFLGGMLHDLGAILALQAVEVLVAENRIARKDLDAVLDPLVDATHNELGRRMAERWKLPAHVVRVCAEHHAPTVGAKEDRELHIVRVVEGLSELGSNPHWPLRRVEEIRESAVGLGVDRFRLRATVTQIREYAKKALQLANAVEPA